MKIWKRNPGKEAHREGTKEKNVLIKKLYYVIAFFIILIGYVLCQGISIWQYASVDETCKADVAIVLGAATSDNEVSPVFRERINQGIRLYQKGYVEKIIITGGYGEGNQYSDAYIGMQYTMKQGIPKDDILMEEKSTITEENLENAKVIMEQKGLQSALIVSDPLHMKRSMLLAEEAGIESYSSPTTTSMYQGTWVKLKFLAREVFFYIGYQVVNLF